MLEKLANVFRVPDLRKRIMFTLGLLAVYRFGGHIPTPGINADLLSQFFDQNRGTQQRRSHADPAHHELRLRFLSGSGKHG